VAIVGSAGFLGRSLTELCRLEGVPHSPFTRAHPIIGSSSWAERAEDARTVFWLASRINPQLAQQDPQLVVEDEAVFSAFLSVAAGRPHPPRVVLISSGGTVYDPRTDPPYHEGSPLGPISAYGRAKLRLEELLLSSALVDKIVVRVANAYGPGQPIASGQGVIAHWLRAARRGENLRIFGPSSITRDYVYIDDIAGALLRIASTEATLPRILNIGSGRPTSLQDLAEALLDVVADPSLSMENEGGRSFDVSHTWLSIDLAFSALGWRPATSLRDGLATAWAAVRTLGDPEAR